MTALKQDNQTVQNPLARLQENMRADMDAVNACIIEYMCSDVALIPQLASYLIASGGKRIRPLLTLAATGLFDGDRTRAHRLAAAVEFIHTATLLHDDVVDDSDERRGQQSANIVFGNEASVLVGDFLFSRAFQLMVKDGSLRVLDVLSNASAVIAEGEVQQLSIQHNIDTDFDAYLSMIKGKTAALFAAACEVGPIIANQSEDIIQAVHDYGMNLGIAFQIIDDVLDYSSTREAMGKAVGDDFKEGKITAPVIYVIQGADENERAFWQKTIGDRQQNEGDLKTAQHYMHQHHAIKKSIEQARIYGGKAIDSLSIVPDSALKRTLIDLIDFTINRSA